MIFDKSFSAVFPIYHVASSRFRKIYFNENLVDPFKKSSEAEFRSDERLNKSSSPSMVKIKADIKSRRKRWKTRLI